MMTVDGFRRALENYPRQTVLLNDKTVCDYSVMVD